MTTTRRELAPRYDAAAVEPAIYERWLAADASARWTSRCPVPSPSSSSSRRRT